MLSDFRQVPAPDSRTRRLCCFAGLLISCVLMNVLFFTVQTKTLTPTELIAPGRVYAIKGDRPGFGGYHGELELRPKADGSIYAIRIVSYDSFRFESRRVQEIWTGSGVLRGTDLDLEFRLKQADIFFDVSTITHSNEAFNNPLKVIYNADLSKPVSSLRISIPDDIHEEELRFARHAGVKPLWQNERRQVVSKGDCFQIVGKWAKLSLFLPVTIKLHFDPMMAEYLQRPEFVSENQYFVYDPSDYQFLQEHPDFIRVCNKDFGLITLVEAACRSDAYGFSLGAKAKIFEDKMKNDHLNELGLYAGVKYDTNFERVGFNANGDGALWSGMYAGAEAMRYLVTRDADALANFKRVSKGLMLLMDLTGNPREFARTAEPLQIGSKLDGHWRRGVVPYEHIRYVEGGNNDMVKGLFHAFAWAYEILPAEDPFLTEVSEHASRLLALDVVAGEKIHPGNTCTAYGLAALASGRKEDLHRYLQFYQTVMKPIDFLNLDKGFYFGGIADWSGVNLGMVAQLNDILVAKNLLKRFENDEAERLAISKTLKGLRQRLVNTWAVYEPARRDFITIAADAFAAGEPEALKFPADTKPVKWPRQESWAKSRTLSIWSLREMPVDNGHSLAFDYQRKPDWCASSWPVRPWKYFVKDNPIEYHLQSAYDYPLFEGHAYDTDIVWTSAFRIRGRSNLLDRSGRFDYLHTYWLGRLSGLIDKDS